MEKLQKLKEERKTEKDLKLSGKQIFEDKFGLSNLVLEGEDEDEEDFKGEDGSDDEEDDEDVKFYDKALYA